MFFNMFFYSCGSLGCWTPVFVGIGRTRMVRSDSDKAGYAGGKVEALSVQICFFIVLLTVVRFGLRIFCVNLR